MTYEVDMNAEQLTGRERIASRAEWRHSVDVIAVIERRGQSDTRSHYRHLSLEVKLDFQTTISNAVVTC